VRGLGEGGRGPELLTEEGWGEEGHADVDDLEVGFYEVVGEAGGEKGRGRREKRRNERESALSLSLSLSPLR